ncbi:MAG: Baseplate hub subunit [Edwardsiella phage MSW-3]|nr:MAG: Baseplate hub subunit [Edwardsiella phage MSW-3]
MTLTPDRIYAQYRNQPKAISWYGIVPKLSGDITTCASVVRNMYDIDANEGVQLDIIGRTVVIDRSYVGQAKMRVVQCGDEVNSQCGDEYAMCSETSVDTALRMSDELFQLVIRAKIIKNNSDSTIESILEGVNILIPDAQFKRVVDHENMSFSIEFYGLISNLERWALLDANLVPKPQGVRFVGFLEAYGYVECGDSSMQCGDPDAQCVGYVGV